MQRFTTDGPYRRNAAHDRRIANGDDFAGDCWEEPGGVRFWVMVGHTPTGPRTFERCDHCGGTGTFYAVTLDGTKPAGGCRHCFGVGWKTVPEPSPNSNA